VSVGTTDFIDNTSAADYIPEIWSQIVLVAREDALVFANLVDRRWEAGLTFGDTIHVNDKVNLTLGTKSEGTAINFENPTVSQIDITIGTHQYAALAVESITKLQADHDLLALYGQKFGYTLGKGVDDALAVLVDALDNSVGALGVDLTDTNIIRSIQYLDDANAPPSQRAYVVSPGTKSTFLGLEKYINNDYSMIHGTGPRTTQQEHAYVTSFYTIPVYMSVNVDGTNAAGHDNALLQKEAISLVMQMKPTFHSAYDIEYFCDKIAIEQVYGCREMRGDHGVCLFGA